jgi:hypothetical protein
LFLKDLQTKKIHSYIVAILFDMDQVKLRLFRLVGQSNLVLFRKKRMVVEAPMMLQVTTLRGILGK